MTMAGDLIAAQSQLMGLGGTQVDLHSPDKTLKGQPRGAFVNWGVEDQALRNDYDKHAQKFQMEVSTVFTPEKQDYILFAGDRWTILDVHTRIISGLPIFHGCVIRK
jgi:hypothetical protein